MRLHVARESLGAGIEEDVVAKLICYKARRNRFVHNQKPERGSKKWRRRNPMKKDKIQYW